MQHATEQATAAVPALQMKQITKRFGHFTALNQVDLSVNTGEVHALLGENGAGKSTLMNCLFGLYGQYDGTIYWEGAPVKITDTQTAIRLGIGMVHQHFMLIPVMSVIENVVLGMADNHCVLDLKAAARRFTQLSQTYHLALDPWVKVEQLSVGQQQRLEILKALYRHARLLILDEPTAVLTPEEVEGLFDIVARLKAEGHTVIFISHKLNEVMKICDRCTILRNGTVAATLKISQIRDRKMLARLMVGDETDLDLHESACSVGSQALLEVKQLSCRGDYGQLSCKKLSFAIRPGEILGICGVDGNGQRELVECLTGLRQAETGQYLVRGRDLLNCGARQLLKCGVSHIPEDRLKYGLASGMNLEENLILADYPTPAFARWGWLRSGRIRRHAQTLCQRYRVRFNSLKQPAAELSGGNQQKLVAARELDRQPELLIAVHPSRGLDVGAARFVQNAILTMKQKGTAILYIAGELDEVLEMSDRILVMYEGQFIGQQTRAEYDRTQIGLMMAGTPLS
ncbi:MAG: ABC transporter ATP-binding protein [Oscillospiraceae bacterium]|nr:ABC transporter ATP-binding protein [Oscillospiraceae bacterium]MDD4367716.1 ABC transporter ATP-binding protein [Oscillospiraceae bacterium]